MQFSPLFTHTWIAIKLILFFFSIIGSSEDFCVIGDGGWSDTSNLSTASYLVEDLWNERKEDLYQCWISASPCLVQEVWFHYREGAFKEASAARGHLGRKKRTTLRNRMEPCWTSTLQTEITIRHLHRACTITSQIKVIFTSLQHLHGREMDCSYSKSKLKVECI